MEQLGFEDEEIEVMLNQTKEKIEQKLKELKSIAKEFEASKQGGETLAIVIINVGLCYDPKAPIFRNLNDDFDLDEQKGPGAYEAFYELTYEGEPLNLNEAAVWIADTRTEEQAKSQAPFSGSTHVMVLVDRLPAYKKLFRNHIYASRDEMKSLEKMRTGGRAAGGRAARANVTFSCAFQVDAVKHDYMLCQPD